MKPIVTAINFLAPHLLRQNWSALKRCHDAPAVISQSATGLAENRQEGCCAEKHGDEHEEQQTN